MIAGFFFRMKIITVVSALHGDQDFLVPERLYNDLLQYEWFLRVSRGTFYAFRYAIVNGEKTTILLHRHIKGVTNPKIFVIHADKKGTNCLEHNLIVSSEIRGKKKASKYPGVSWENSTGKWKAVTTTDKGERKFLGRFEEEKMARRAIIALKGRETRDAIRVDTTEVIPKKAIDEGEKVIIVKYKILDSRSVTVSRGNFEKLSSYVWKLSWRKGMWHVYRKIAFSNRRVYMDKQIAGLMGSNYIGAVVRHIDKSGLNCAKENLEWRENANAPWQKVK